jgi:hypothetical protein
MASLHGGVRGEGEGDHMLRLHLFDYYFIASAPKENVLLLYSQGREQGREIIFFIVFATKM